MTARGVILASLCLAVSVVALAGGAPAWALDNGNGKVWRQVTDTTGVTAAEVAQVCPQDGATRCSGSIGGRLFTDWIWATADQVVGLMGNYEPAILTADPPSIAGPDYFLPAMNFHADIRPTFSISGYEFFSASVQGWTSSTDEEGLPVSGAVGGGWWPPSGSFGVAGVTDGVNPFRGVWLWRPSSDDLTAPVITPSVAGTLGANGWYVSDVSVSWEVQDPDSEISSQAGCDPLTVAADTAGTTFTCEATSGGGTTSESTVVNRDTTPPTVTCPSPAPVFQLYQLGAWVTASVTDETSGRAAAPAQGAANTNTPGTFTTSVTGADRAGNKTTTQCAYQVVVPTCNGLTPTRVGTALNDVITGTSGRDVVLGLAGADTINGLGGDDVICGGDGPDVVYGGDGADWVDGGASPDDLNGDNGNDFLDGGLHNDSLRGGNGTDTCRSGETRMSSCEL
ncbi:MAG TPA: calcium-binding protein [Gaiellaceae bacterium]|nr:calcium-binding protein [Gaiellaceae bacterium]